MVWPETDKEAGLAYKFIRRGGGAGALSYLEEASAQTRGPYRDVLYHKFFELC
jgi:hypothetical protein